MGRLMAITKVERARIADSRRKIKSVSDSLKHVDPKKIQDYDAIEDCLEQAEANLAEALDPEVGRTQ
jgi:hypothetical protein